MVFDDYGSASQHKTVSPLASFWVTKLPFEADIQMYIQKKVGLIDVSMYLFILLFLNGCINM